MLFTEDCSSTEAIVDRYDAVIVPRDYAAIYPIELSEGSARQCNPVDVCKMPPGKLWGDTGLWEEEIVETKQRLWFRDMVAKLDPRLGVLYTDRCPRFRTRAHYVIGLPWSSWNGWYECELGGSLEEAEALVEEMNTAI